MSDFFQQHQNQQKINEKLFDRLFSKTEKTEPESTDFVQLPNGTFVFNLKSTAKTINTPAAIPRLKEHDWANSSLNFLLLPGTEFHAKHLELDLKKEKLISFEGTWKSGPFFGGVFEGKFLGSSFNGDFVGKYTDYQSHPTTFVDGTFLDTTESGLLGMPNMITLHKARNRKFNLITIPAGYYLQFRSVNGITGYIKVLKRLDEVNSDFKFEVLDGFKGSKTPKIIDLPWNYFRQNWKIMDINPKNPRNLGGLILVPEGDSIKEMYISTAPATFQTEPAELEQSFDPNKSYAFDLSKIPYVNIKSLPGEEGEKSSEVFLKFDSPEEFKEFQKIVSYIDSGTFVQDMKTLYKAIKYGEVDGYGPLLYLRTLFNNNPGREVFNLFPDEKKKKIAEAGVLSKPKFKTPSISGGYSAPGLGAKTQTEEPQFGTLYSLQRLNDFIRFFVENIVDSNGTRDEATKNTIIDRLKISLGANNIQPTKSQSVSTQNPEEKPVVDPGVSRQNDDDDDIVSRMGLKKESIRHSVRKIINDNF